MSGCPADKKKPREGPRGSREKEVNRRAGFEYLLSKDEWRRELVDRNHGPFQSTKGGKVTESRHHKQGDLLGPSRQERDEQTGSNHRERHSTERRISLAERRRHLRVNRADAALRRREIRRMESTSRSATMIERTIRHPTVGAGIREVQPSKPEIRSKFKELAFRKQL